MRDLHSRVPASNQRPKLALVGCPCRAAGARGVGAVARKSVDHLSWSGPGTAVLFCTALGRLDESDELRRRRSASGEKISECADPVEVGVSPVKFQTRWRQCEAYLSTKCPEAGPPPRFPASYVVTLRADDHQEPSSARPGPVVSLIERVTDRGSFVALRHPAKRVRRGVLRIAFVPDEAGRRRIAYALSRRVGNAVVRNRIKRRLRCVFTTIDRERVTGNVAFPPGTYLVSATAAAADVPFQTLLRTATSLLNELEQHGASR